MQGSLAARPRLSREQVYRLVTRTPQRLSLATLAALCDILGCSPGDLVEPVAPGAGRQGHGQPGSRPVALARPVRALVLHDQGKNA
jgi:DNA-binding Xre family transcriptional regulator